MKKNELRFIIREVVSETMQEMALPNTKAVNREIQALTVNNYFQSIPAGEIQAILDKYGMGTNVETNERVMDGIYTGHQGEMNEPIARDARGNPARFFRMTWYKMASGRYEIVAYVS